MGCGSSIDMSLFRFRYPKDVAVLDDSHAKAILKDFHAAMAAYHSPHAIKVLQVADLLKIVPGLDTLPDSFMFHHAWKMSKDKLGKEAGLQDHQFVRFVEMVCLPSKEDLVNNLFTAMSKTMNESGESEVFLAELPRASRDKEFWRVIEGTTESTKSQETSAPRTEVVTRTEMLQLFRVNNDVAEPLLALQAALQAHYFGPAFWAKERRKPALLGRIQPKSRNVQRKRTERRVSTSRSPSATSRSGTSKSLRSPKTSARTARTAASSASMVSTARSEGPERVTPVTAKHKHVHTHTPQTRRGSNAVAAVTAGSVIYDTPQPVHGDGGMPGAIP